MHRVSMASVVEQYAQHPDLAGKRVLVTGSSSGIGKAVALAFAAQNAGSSADKTKICVMSRSKTRLQSVVDEIESHGAAGYAVAGDLTKGEDCQRAVEEAADLMGGLDVLINNGSCCSDLGAQHYGMADEIEFMENYKTHVASAVIMMKAALPHLVKSRGNIVNMSSMMSQTYKTIQMAYNASKAMEDAVTKNFAMLHAKDGVRINSVNPGYVLTDVYDRLAKDEGKTRAAMEAYTAVQHPMGRNARVEEVASVCLFLASQAASFITEPGLPSMRIAQVNFGDAGVSIPVDGGGLLTSWFNLDLQPTIAANGEDVVFSNGSSANAAAGNGQAQESGMKEGMLSPAKASRQAVKASAQSHRLVQAQGKHRQQLRPQVRLCLSVRHLTGPKLPCNKLA